MFNQNNVSTVTNNRVGQVLAKTYSYLAMSVVISCISAFAIAHTPIALTFAQAGIKGLIVAVLILLVEFAMIGSICKNAVQNPGVGLVTLIMFSVLDGATLSYIGLIYAPQLVIQAFGLASIDFIGMSIVGYATKNKNLSNLRRVLYGMVIALIVVMIFDFFIQSSAILMFFSFIGLLIFSALALVDTNFVVRMANNTDYPIKSIAIVGALQLYIDFENIFIDILNLTSNN